MRFKATRNNMTEYHVIKPANLCHEYGSATERYLLPTVISNGSRTAWSPIRSVIIRVITRSDDCAAGVLFVNHEYDYRPNQTTR